MAQSLNIALLSMVLKYFIFFFFHSNKFASEKGKLEELIKKSQSDSQECEKRAVTAEVQPEKKNILKNLLWGCADWRVGEMI